MDELGTNSLATACRQRYSQATVTSLDVREYRLNAFFLILSKLDGGALTFLRCVLKDACECTAMTTWNGQICRTLYRPSEPSGRREHALS